MRAIWRDGKKYAWKDSGLEHLFDLRKDPREQTNLLKTNPHLTDELRTLMRQYFDDAPYAPDSKSEGEISPEDRETLEALGYID